MTYRQAFFVLCSLPLFVGMGCGSNGVEKPATFPVSGVVIYQGKPVEGATVAFSTEKAPRISSGVTDSEGKFALSMFKAGDGAVAGTHQVTIIKLDPQLQQQPDEDANAYTTRVLGKDPGKSLLPAIYANLSKTPLSAEVSASETNHFQFELK
ncbi:MAG TPA: hypothetical protein VNQ76_06020 [Planctomicrobium sp.]|nr:hypothetical protein [Planctomicrobium sp.]